MNSISIGGYNDKSGNMFVLPPAKIKHTVNENMRLTNKNMLVNSAISKYLV